MSTRKIRPVATPNCSLEKQPANFDTDYLPGATTTGEGSTALGFYNVQKGDVPYFKSLADTYAMSDNFHQSVNGGTGANHIMLGHGDALWFSDGEGHAETPPHKVEVAAGSANAGVVDDRKSQSSRGHKTTGTQKMATALALLALHLPAAAPTAIAQTRRNRESPRL
jgi:Phosphoesterase family